MYYVKLPSVAERYTVMDGWLFLNLNAPQYASQKKKKKKGREWGQGHNKNNRDLNHCLQWLSPGIPVYKVPKFINSTKK